MYKLKPKSEFSRNVLTLMTGTTIAQAIPIAISPILTRIYTPEDFGVFALYMSVASILSVVATGRYELAIMLPKKDEDAINIVALSIAISFLVSFIAFLVVFFFNDSITKLLGNPEISSWLYFIPLSVLLTGIYQSFNYWGNRKKEYKILATSRVIRSGTMSASNLAFGFGGFGSGGLIGSSILGQGVASIVLGKIVYKKDKDYFCSINKLKMFALIKKYKKFPLVNLFHAFVNILKENIVNIFIAIKYTQTLLGYYYFMLRLMKMPFSILGSSLSQVFYKEAVSEFNKCKNIQSLVLKFIIKLFFIACFPIIFLYFYSEELFVFIFGKEWLISGIFAKNISLYILLHFIASPLGMVPLIVGKQEEALIWGIFETIIFVLVYIVSYMVFHDLKITLIMLSIIMSIFFIIYFIWIYQISKGIK